MDDGFSERYNFEGAAGDQAENEQDIESLLETGYEMLDGFTAWVDERLEMGARIAEQDSFNAEFLIDYLANHHRKSIAEINEFDLRWFMFSHYIRKSLADEETAARLPESLQRFFGYLSSEQHELVPEWVGIVLDDVGFYAKRQQAYAALNTEDERAWEMGFREWSEELEEDLDTRVLWLPRDIGDGMQWGDRMGWREATLYEVATQNWQTQREQLLRRGEDFEGMRAELQDNYYAWLEGPQSRLEEQTPREVIQTERLERAESEEPDDSFTEDDLD